MRHWQPIATDTRQRKGSIMAAELKFYYDKLIFSSGTSYVFFDDIGSSHLVNNLSKAGEIDEDKSFDIRSLRFFLAAVTTPMAPFILLLEGIITLVIGGDPKLRVPAWMCPGGGGPVVQDLIDPAVTSYTMNGSANPKDVFVLDPPITIPPGTSFKVVLDFAADPTLTTTPFMWMVLGGREY